MMLWAVLLCLAAVPLARADSCKGYAAIPGIPGAPGQPGSNGQDGVDGPKGEKGEKEAGAGSRQSSGPEWCYRDDSSSLKALSE